MGCASEIRSEARLNFDQRLRRFPELFLTCLLHNIQKVTGNRGGVSCHCTPKLVLRRSSSARMRICGAVGCRKTCCVWLRQCPRSSLHGKEVPGGECSQAKRLRRAGGKSTRIEHFGRAPRGVPVVFDCGERGGFPRRTKSHKCCCVNLVHEVLKIGI